MCMLTYIPANVDPDIDSLYNATWINNDGHGFAIVDDGQLIVRKSMNPDRLLDQFEDMRNDHRGDALFHSRMSTAGTVDESNCHPFYVGSDIRTVVGHNGIISQCNPKRKNDLRSDTAIFAQSELARRNLNRKRSRRRLAEWIGRYNKLVILSANPDNAYTALIINEASGHWDNGIWYSNTDYRTAWTKWLYPQKQYVVTASATATDRAEHVWSNRCNWCERPSSGMYLCDDCRYYARLDFCISCGDLGDATESMCGACLGMVQKESRQ